MIQFILIFLSIYNYSSLYNLPQLDNREISIDGEGQDSPLLPIGKERLDGEPSLESKTEEGAFDGIDQD